MLWLFIFCNFNGYFPKLVCNALYFDLHGIVTSNVYIPRCSLARTLRMHFNVFCHITKQVLMYFTNSQVKVK